VLIDKSRLICSNACFAELEIESIEDKTLLSSTLSQVLWN